jgi:hypothetical protein
MNYADFSVCGGWSGGTAALSRWYGRDVNVERRQDMPLRALRRRAMATNPAEPPESVNSAPLIVDQPRHPGRRTWSGGEESDEKSLAELLKDLSEQTANLVHQEVELAKAEMSVKGKLLAAGAALFAAAGVLGILAVAALVACAIAGLSEALPVWLAALIVAVVLGGVAGILALLGKSETQRGSPPVPEEALESTKEDVEWLKIQAKSAKP